MPAPQTYKNHTQFFPPFHFVLMPILLANLIIAINSAIRHWPDDPRLHLWWIVMSIAFLLTALLSRMMALKAQDRIIRLEERLRLATLLPPAGHALIHRLTTGQLVALRFASDTEVVGLAQRAADQNLTRKAIKQAIVTWRPDHERV